MTGSIHGASVVTGRSRRRGWFSGLLTGAVGCALLGGVVGVVHVHVVLVALPPLVQLLRQGYGHRQRTAGERRGWIAFTELTQTLNRLDERGVVVAALRGAALLFGSDDVELVACRQSGQRWRYTARTSDLTVVGRPAEAAPIIEGPDAPTRDGPAEVVSGQVLSGQVIVRRLAVGDVAVGELRLRYRRPVRFADHDRRVLAAFAAAVSSALYGATTHRQLTVMLARSEYDAIHDPLSGLSNRATLLARGNAELQQAGAGTPVALLVFDVDGFREVNATLGRAAGDELLRLLARRLLDTQTRGELLGHLGGSEYAVLSTGPRAASRTYALERARAVAALLALPAQVAGVTIAVAASAGVVTEPAGECDLAELVRRADVALYQAKRSGSRVAGYDPASDATSVDRLALLADLRDALAATDQIVLLLQPAVDLASGDPTGVEALVRWHHPRRGLLAPAEFISVMEHSDLVDAFTRYVIDQALRIAAGWATQGVHVPISVNLSARSLLDRDLPAMVAAHLRAHEVPAHRLTLEITETAMVSELAVIDEVLSGLRSIGVKVSVDDFGTGYSSLKFLTRVPVDEVKIDRAFVAHLGDSPEATAIVRTTVDLARELGLHVVAEGVETAAQRAALVALGATSAQGFLFYPAMGVEQATAVIQGRAQAQAARDIPIVRATESGPATGS